MKAKELMIGDLIYEGSDHQIKVSANYGRSVSYIEGKYTHEVEETYLNPIPLTEEILKLNGFEKSGISYLHRYDDKPHHYDFKLNEGGALGKIGFSIDCDIYILTIWYVHELQHALRLCGLNELADNFKIK